MLTNKIYSVVRIVQLGECVIPGVQLEACRWLAAFPSCTTKLARKRFLLWVQSLMLFFLFFFFFHCSLGTKTMMMVS